MPQDTWAENKESSRCTNMKYHRNNENIESFRNIDISEILFFFRNMLRGNQENQAKSEMRVHVGKYQMLPKYKRKLSTK